MESRTDKRSRKANEKGKNTKKLAVILFCAVFFLSAISLADYSTKKMMLCKDDSYAFGISKAGADMLRVDIAGERYMLNYSSLKKAAVSISKESSKAIKNITLKIKYIFTE